MGQRALRVLEDHLERRPQISWLPIIGGSPRPPAKRKILLWEARRCITGNGPLPSAYPLTTYCGPGKGEAGSAGIPQHMGKVPRIPEHPQLLGWAWEKVDSNPSVGRSETGSASGHWRGRAVKIPGGHASTEGSLLFSQGRCWGASPAAQWPRAPCYGSVQEKCWGRRVTKT